MGIFHFGSAGGLGIALLFEIIALSTPGWVYITTNTTMLNVTGLPPYSQYYVIRSAAYGLFYSSPGVDSQYGLCKLKLFWFHIKIIHSTHYSDYSGSALAVGMLDLLRIGTQLGQMVCLARCSVVHPSAYIPIEVVTANWRSARLFGQVCIPHALRKRTICLIAYMGSVSDIRRPGTIRHSRVEYECW